MVDVSVAILSDYLGDLALQFDVVTHVQVRHCPLTVPHAHVQCASCQQRFVLDLDTFDQALAALVRQHALSHQR